MATACMKTLSQRCISIHISVGVGGTKSSNSRLKISLAAMGLQENFEVQVGKALFYGQRVIDDYIQDQYCTCTAG